MKGFIFLLFSMFVLAAQAQVSVVWDVSYGGVSTEYLKDMEPTADGGYILTGYSRGASGDRTEEFGDYDGWVVKTDANGALEWQKSYGGSDRDFLYGGIQTSDGGYIFTGETASYEGNLADNHGARDVWMIRTDASGNVIWERTYGGSHTDTGFNIIELSDGSFVIGASSSSHDFDVTRRFGNGGYWCFKISSVGDIIWQKKYATHLIQYVSGVRPAPDGGFYMMGQSQHHSGDMTVGLGKYDLWVLKLDSNGDLEWDRSLGGSLDDRSGDLLPTADGGYIVFGHSKSIDIDVSENKGGSDWWLAKLDKNNVIEWQKSYGGSRDEVSRDITATPDGGYAMTGYTWSNDGDVPKTDNNADIWVMQVDAIGNVVWSRTIGKSNENLGAKVLAKSNGNIILGATGGDSDPEDITIEKGYKFYWLAELTHCPSLYEGDETATICEGNTFTFGTQDLTTTGTFTEIFKNRQGCDSTVNLALTVLPSSHSSCNTPPAIESTLADLSLVENFVAFSLDLKSAFEDAETTDEQLLYSVTGHTLMQIDIVDGVATFSSLASSFGSETIVFTVEDEAGEQISQSILVHIAALPDTDPPVMVCLPNQDVACTDLVPDLLPLISVTDNQDPNPVLVQIPAAGSPMVAGMFVTIQAEDATGNTSFCTVFFNIAADVEDPSMVCPADIVLACGAPLPNLTGTTSASDNCSAVVLAQSVPAGTIINENIEVEIKATDATGNSNTCTVFVVVEQQAMIFGGTAFQVEEGSSLVFDLETNVSGKAQWTPTLFLDNPNLLNPTCQPNASVAYELVFTSDGGCEQSKTIEVIVTEKEPETTKYGLSPNGDGLYDTWVIEGIEGYPNNKVTVFNRWGDVVFQTAGYDNFSKVFDGYGAGGQLLPNGTYFFSIETAGEFQGKRTGYLIIKE